MSEKKDTPDFRIAKFGYTSECLGIYKDAEAMIKDNFARWVRIGEFDILHTTFNFGGIDAYGIKIHNPIKWYYKADLSQTFYWISGGSIVELYCENGKALSYTGIAKFSIKDNQGENLDRLWKVGRILHKKTFILRGQ